jgi:signal recognition particle GTPase
MVCLGAAWAVTKPAWQAETYAGYQTASHTHACICSAFECMQSAAMQLSFPTPVLVQVDEAMMQEVKSMQARLEPSELLLLAAAATTG